MDRLDLFSRATCLVTGSKQIRNHNNRGTLYDTPELLVSFIDEGPLKVVYVPSNLEDEASAYATATLNADSLERLGELAVMGGEEENSGVDFPYTFTAQDAQVISLSPTGRHLFVGRYHEDGAAVIYVDLNTRHVTSENSNDTNNSIHLLSFLANDKRLIQCDRDEAELQTLASASASASAGEEEQQNDEEEGDEEGASGMQRVRNKIIELTPVEPRVPNEEDYDNEAYEREFFGSNKAKNVFAVYFKGHDLISVYDIEGKVLKSVKLTASKLDEYDPLNRPFCMRFDESFTTLLDLRTLTVYSGLFEGKHGGGFDSRLFQYTKTTTTHTNNTHTHTHTPLTLLGSSRVVKTVTGKDEAGNDIMTEHIVHDYAFCDELTKKISCDFRDDEVATASDDLSLFVIASHCLPPRFYRLDVATAKCTLVYQCASAPAPPSASPYEPVFTSLAKDDEEEEEEGGGGNEQDEEEEAAEEEVEKVDEEDGVSSFQDFYKERAKRQNKRQKIFDQGTYVFSPVNNDLYSLIRTRDKTTKSYTTHLVKWLPFSWIRRRNFCMFLACSGLLRSNSDAPPTADVRVFSSIDTCSTIASFI